MSSQEQEIILGLLDEVERDSRSSQRAIAKRLGIALGLANAYLNRCIKKGFIKVSEAPANRYLYYLTPSGFTEKARLSSEYLRQSFGFFRTARQQCEDALQECLSQGYRTIALAGCSEFAEIMILTAADKPVRLVGLFDPDGGGTTLAGLQVMSQWEALPPHDAVVMTCLSGGEQLWKDVAGRMGAERVIVPPMLRIPVLSSRTEPQPSCVSPL